MKKQLLVLTAMTALLLVGCNSSKTGTLPSGGKDVDVTTEDGQATLKAKLNSTVEAYKNLKLDSASLTATTSGVNVSADVKASMTNVGEMSLNASLKDFGAKVELKAARHEKGEGEEYDSLDASLVAKTTGGSVKLSGSVPGEEEGKTAKLDASLSLKGAEVGAYVTGSKLYVNLANDGNQKLAEGVDAFANKLLGQLKESSFGSLISLALMSDDVKDIYNDKEGKFVIADAYKEHAADANVFLDLGKPVEFPKIEIEQNEDYTDFIKTIEDLAAKKVGFSFKTYSNNAYGFALAMDKESLKKMILAENDKDAQETVTQIDKYIGKFSLNADIYFNKDLLLESAGVSFNLEGSLDKEVLGEEASMFESFSAKLSAKGSEKMEIKYNNAKVDFPSFEGYKEYKLFGGSSTQQSAQD